MASRQVLSIGALGGAVLLFLIVVVGRLTGLFGGQAVSNTGYCCTTMGQACQANMTVGSCGAAGGTSFVPDSTPSAQLQCNISCSYSGGGSSSSAVSCNQGTSTKYFLSANYYGTDIVTGPDGALWFAQGNGKIGRVTTAGVFSEFTSPVTPGSITLGPDNNLWIIGGMDGPVVKMTPAGVTTTYALPVAGSRPISITSGPDGALWFTEHDSKIIGRITTSGNITEYPLPPSTVGSPLRITTGADGNLWVANSFSIIRVTPSGVMTEFPLPSGKLAYHIVSGSDGALWFVDGSNTEIGRITTAGTISSFPTRLAPATLTRGVDGNIWFLMQTGSTEFVVGRMTPTGTVTEFPVSWMVSGQKFYGITPGPDNNIWFTVGGAGQNAVGKFALSCGSASSAPAAACGNSKRDAGETCDDGNTAAGDGCSATCTVETGWKCVAQTGGSASSSGTCTSGNIAITDYDIPDTLQAMAYPKDITVGADGKLWFVESGTSYGGTNVSNITTAGVITQYSLDLAPGVRNLHGITKGPDNNIWFTGVEGHISKVTSTGVLSYFPIPANGQPKEIITGPDNNLWFVEQNSNKIKKMTTAGVVTSYTIPTINSAPQGLIVGPDDNIWFTESLSGKIGKITTAGVFTEYAVAENAKPIDIVWGADGNLWFTLSASTPHKIGKITTAGVITTYPLPTTNAVPQGITRGPDGNVWFLEAGFDKIGKITPAGVITEYSLPAIPGGSRMLEDMTLGPDNNLWLTEFGYGKIGKLTICQ